MIDAALAEKVEEVVRTVVDAEVLPRWRKLADHEVTTKAGPHDLVTVADRVTERTLGERLTALLPGSVVVGEEAVDDDPAVLAALDGDAPVWVVDPVDGTRQFVRGEPGFCTLVALVRHGRALASWTYAPVREQLAHARWGGGAYLNGRRLTVRPPSPGKVLEVACSHPDYTTDEQKRALWGLWAPGVAPRACGAAGLEYLGVAVGRVDAVAFTWEYPWDHAAGLLLVTEAGGTNLTLEGRPFRLSGGNALPFTAARDEKTARRIHDLLTGS
jgi:fructose-1,6-bisphosphatase/inositol monophosphatase family enzyme